MPEVRAKRTLVPKIVRERDISMDSRGLFDFMGLCVQSKRSHLLTRTYELRLLSLNNLPYSVENGKQSLENSVWARMPRPLGSKTSFDFSDGDRRKRCTPPKKILSFSPGLILVLSENTNCLMTYRQFKGSKGEPVFKRKNLQI
jgi:hypothetical protein